MAVTDELRLKVSAAEYQKRIGLLDNKIRELNEVMGEYETLKKDAVKVLGDGDSNLQKMQDSVQKNINAVKGQMELLKESRQMLQRQMENLDELSGQVSKLFEESAETAKTAFNTVKIVGDLVN